MVRKSSKSPRSRRANCSGARKSSCALRKNCAWKKSRGCRRKRSAARMSKYEKVYKSVVRRAGKKSRRSARKSPRRRMTAYTKFVKENMSKVSGANKMAKVAAMWRKRSGARPTRKCSRGMRKGSRVCKRKPGPKKSRSPRRRSAAKRA